LPALIIRSQHFKISRLWKTLWYLHCQKNKDKLYEDHPIFEKLSRIMAQRAQIASQHRIISSIGFTAQERYLDFIKRYPKIYPRISNMQLASYLGVTQEFLSRLKRQILKPNRNS
jgi:CRP-like cAMP-binding protein